MPKGYAYMELSDEETAQVALNMTGVQFMGRTIRVRALCSLRHLLRLTHARQVHAYRRTANFCSSWTKLWDVGGVFVGYPGTATMISASMVYAHGTVLS